MCSVVKYEATAVVFVASKTRCSRHFGPPPWTAILGENVLAFRSKLQYTVLLTTWLLAFLTLDFRLSRAFLSDPRSASEQ